MPKIQLNNQDEEANKKAIMKKQAMDKKIDYLKNVPQPDQRTNEWYIFRHNCHRK